MPSIGVWRSCIASSIADCVFALDRAELGGEGAGGRLVDLTNRRKKNVLLRAKLQAKGTKPAKRLLKKRSKKEARFVADVNHQVSKKIVAGAKRTGRGIAIEDLSGVRARVRLRKPQRAAVHSWAFAQLETFLTYKAAAAGVALVQVDPAYTSQTCSGCGHVSAKNRPNQARFVCRACGVLLHADHNAAINIARRGRDGWGASPQVVAQTLGAPPRRAGRPRRKDLASGRRPRRGGPPRPTRLRQVRGRPRRGTRGRHPAGAGLRHPPIKMHVVVHQMVARRCGCGAVTRRQGPDQVNAPAAYGPVARSVMVYLLMGQFLSRGRTADDLSELFGAPVSAATVAAATTRAADDLAPFLSLVTEQIVAAAVAHFDETGLRCQGRQAWLHSAFTDTFALLYAHPNRGRAAMGAYPGAEA